MTVRLRFEPRKPRYCRNWRDGCNLPTNFVNWDFKIATRSMGFANQDFKIATPSMGFAN
jgi:hypothetical protein